MNYEIINGTRLKRVHNDKIHYEKKKPYQLVLNIET